MKENEVDQGRFTQDAHGVGTVTEEMVLQRARELAVINGRLEKQVLESDIRQARHELTGRERLEPPLTKEEELPEDRRWEPVPISFGSKAPTVPASDEQTFAEKLVEEGVEDAEKDQALRATRRRAKIENE
jgi:hypothetical protein